MPLEGCGSFLSVPAIAISREPREPYWLPLPAYKIGGFLRAGCLQADGFQGYRVVQVPASATLAEVANCLILMRKAAKIRVVMGLSQLNTA